MSKFRVAASALSVVLAGCVAWIMMPLPSAMTSRQGVPSLTLLDRAGLPLRTTRSPIGERGGWLPISQIDPDIIRAFMAAEDARFFDHHGVDVRALSRATRDNMLRRRVVSGASTITMQTARLLTGTGRSWPGKIAQVMWALRLEAHLSKSDILECYLNRVPLGQGAVGVAAASTFYFDANASDLSLGQAALLAGLARVPARDNPLASAQRATARRASVLARMRRLGYALPDDAERANAEPLFVNTPAGRFLAPHFTTRVVQSLGPSASGTVRTSLDISLQHALESEVEHTVASLHDRKVAQAAVVVLDNRSGEVLGWVGSPDFYADTSGQVDMVVSARQPGSALKPFLYGLAFDRGFTAATVLPDVPHAYTTATGVYKPQNYDRHFRGPVRAREALASSFNVPAVELADRVGPGALLRTLQDAGFKSLAQNADHYGLGLALGNGDVTLLELANAYRGIANGGVARPYTWVTDAPKRAESHRFMSQGAAALVLDILSDPVARIPGFGVETPLDFPFPAASKTGTSRHFTDNWAVATTANFTVAVWVGNFSGRPMQGVSGITGAGPLLYRAALETAKRYPPGYLVTPEQAGLVAEPVCILSGMRATSECPSMVEWFVPGTEPRIADDWQVAGRTTLPAEYAEWAANFAPRTSVSFASDEHGAGPWTAKPHIVSPQDGDRYSVPVGVDPRYATLPLVAEGDKNGVRWSVDGHRITSARWRLVPGNHIIRAGWPSGAEDIVRIVVE